MTGSGDFSLLQRELTAYRSTEMTVSMAGRHATSLPCTRAKAILTHRLKLHSRASNRLQRRCWYTSVTKRRQQDPFTSNTCWTSRTQSCRKATKPFGYLEFQQNVSSVGANYSRKPNKSFLSPDKLQFQQLHMSQIQPPGQNQHVDPWISILTTTRTSSWSQGHSKVMASISSVPYWNKCRSSVLPVSSVPATRQIIFLKSKSFRQTQIFAFRTNVKCCFWWQQEHEPGG